MNVLLEPRLDRLSALLSQFSLSVRVEFAGPLDQAWTLTQKPGLGGFYILRSGTVHLDRRQTVLAPALILIPRPGRHLLHAVAGETVHLVGGTLDFGPTDLNPIIAALPSPAVIPLDKTLEATLNLLEHEAVAPRCGAQAVIDRACEILLIQALRHLIASQGMQTGVLGGLADPKLARALTAIHADPAHPWTLLELARLSGMSRTAFAMGFHHRVGRTVGDYLGWWRASLAKRLLEQGQTLKIVAGAVGYESAPALARQMRRTLGLGPRDIRRQMKD